MQHIILDTNILMADFLLKTSPSHIQLVKFVRRANSSIVLPQIVLEETEAHYQRQLHAKRLSLEKAMKDYQRIAGSELDIPEQCFERTIDNYANYLGRQLWGLLEILPYKQDYLDEVVSRAINRRKPCSSSGEGFRDAILWLTIIDFAKWYKSEPVVFITNNTRDFCDSDNRTLHHQLQEELTGLGLTIALYTSLSGFLAEHGTKTEWATKEWVLRSLAEKNIDGELVRSVTEINYANYLWVFSKATGQKEDMLDDYEVLEVMPCKNDTSYYLCEGDNEHTLVVTIYGTTNVLFIDQDKIEKRALLDFHVTIAALCNSEGIIRFLGDYTEECGLSLI